MAEVYPSNSNRAKESSLIREQPMPEQVDIPKAPERQAIKKKERKISPVREVFAAVFPGGFAEVKERLIWDIFVPWAQDVLKSGWNAIGDVIFPGSGGRTANTAPKAFPEQYSYNTPYRYDSVSYPAYDNTYYNEMRPMRTREDAEAALRDLHAMWLRYRVVTLLDFNERVGNPTRPTQVNYGWLNLDSARVIRANGGWVIDMPRAVAIDNR